MKTLIPVLLIVAVFTANCSTSRSGTAIPTQQLNPVAATATTAVIASTPTTSSLSAPGDLSRPSGGARPEDNPVALFALDDLANNHGIARASAQVVSVEPVEWRNTGLECGDEVSGAAMVNGFRVLIVAGEKVYEYHTDSASTVKMCGESVLADNVEMIMRLDPTAGEMVSLAKAQVERDFGVAQRNMTVVRVVPKTWPNTGLGCPVEGQMYAQMMVPGYEIVLSSGDSEYIFHSDYARVTLCESK